LDGRFSPWSPVPNEGKLGVAHQGSRRYTSQASRTSPHLFFLFCFCIHDPDIRNSSRILPTPNVSISDMETIVCDIQRSSSFHTLQGRCSCETSSSSFPIHPLCLSAVSQRVLSSSYSPLRTGARHPNVCEDWTHTSAAW